MNRIMASEKEKGQRQAAQGIQDLLGCTPEEAKKLIDAQREADKAAMTEAERIKAEAEDEKKSAAGERAEGKREKRDARIVMQLAAAGVTPEVDDKGNLAGRASRIVKLLDLPDDADAAAIKSAIDKLKGEEPSMFGALPDPSKPPSGDPPGNPPPAQPAETAFDQGRKAAQQRNQATAPAFDPKDPFNRNPAGATTTS